MHPQPVAPEGPIEPRPAAGAEVEGSAEASRAETTVEAPVQLLGRRGFTRRPLALREAPRGHQAPRRVLPPEQGMYWFLNFLLIFCFSLSSNSRCLISHQPKAQRGFSGTCSPKGRGGGLSQPLGQRGPGRCPPRAVKRASSPTRKGGRRRGGRRQIPRRKRRGRQAPKSRRGQSWPSGLFPLWGTLARMVRVILDRPRRARPRWR